MKKEFKVLPNIKQITQKEIEDKFRLLKLSLEKERQYFTRFLKEKPIAESKNWPLLVNNTKIQDDEGVKDAKLE